MRLNLPVRLPEHIPPRLHTNTRVVGRLHSAGERATLPGVDVETSPPTATFKPLPFHPQRKVEIPTLAKSAPSTTCVGHLASRCAAPNACAPAVLYNTTIDSMRNQERRLPPTPHIQTTFETPHTHSAYPDIQTDRARTMSRGSHLPLPPPDEEAPPRIVRPPSTSLPTSA